MQVILLSIPGQCFCLTFAFAILSCCSSQPCGHRPGKSGPFCSLVSDVYLCVVDFLFIVTHIVGVCNYSMLCCTLLYVHSSIAIILVGKRELIALLNLSSWCLVMVEWLFLAVPQGSLQFVIVVFPDHTHLLFLSLSHMVSLVRSKFT